MIQMKTLVIIILIYLLIMLDKGIIISNKQFLKDMRSYVEFNCKKYSMSMDYFNWLRDVIKNLKTITKKL